MNEYLIIRLSNQTDAKVFWWCWSPSEQAVIRQGELASIEDIRSLNEEGAERKVVLLLSAADVSLKSVSLPNSRIRHLEKVVPYLVEEEFSEDVESLHFTLLHRVGTEVAFAAVERAWLAELIERFSSQGLTVDKVLPDVLALPDDGISVLHLNHEWLIRQSDYQGVVIEESWLPYYLHQLTATQPVTSAANATDAESDEPDEDRGAPTPSVSNEPHTVHLYSAVPESMLSQTEDWQIHEQTSPLPLLSEGAIGRSVNLLSGEFRPKSSFSVSWNIWKKCAIALVAMVVVGVAYQLIHAHQLETRTAALRTENARIFHAVFPDKKRIPTTGYLKRQFNNELARLSGGTSQSSVIKMFQAIASTLGHQPDVAILKFSFDEAKGSIRLDLQGKDFAAFETARKSLEGVFQVKQGPLNKSKDVVLGSYTLEQK